MELVLVSGDSEPLDSDAVARLYTEYSGELRAFLLGVLRNSDLASEALQATFVKVLEAGHKARKETFKGWLFKVALHEALGIRRKRLSEDKQRRIQGAFNNPIWSDLVREESPDERIVREETIDRVRQQLKTLPSEQQEIVRLKIFEDWTFARIAEELQIPLGTVQTRMRLALSSLSGKLTERLDDEQTR